MRLRDFKASLASLTSPDVATADAAHAALLEWFDTATAEMNEVGGLTDRVKELEEEAAEHEKEALAAEAELDELRAARPICSRCLHDIREPLRCRECARE